MREFAREKNLYNHRLGLNGSDFLVNVISTIKVKHIERKTRDPIRG